GKNATTDNAVAIDDYTSCLETLYRGGDFFVLNVSSPNTQNLRDWQQSDALHRLLVAVLKKRDQLAEQQQRRAPIAVKIAPDMTDDDVRQLAAVIGDTGADGVVATNTTTARPPAVAALLNGQQSGGLSGPPLKERATAIIKILRTALPPEIAIIGVGGIAGIADAEEKLAAGADLLQLYTGLIYRGATLPLDIIQHWQ
nr:dihydroorotate dehydrogenase (quinone) [Pseudomonadota bacterium]